MTEEKLTELNNLFETITRLKEAISEIDTHDYIAFYGGYHGDSAKDWMFDSDSDGCSGLKDYILDFLRKRLAEAEKLFEEG